MGGSFITGNFPGKFEWCGPPNFNVPKTRLKARSCAFVHWGEDGSFPLALNLWAISRCVLVPSWMTGQASVSFISGPREF